MAYTPITYDDWKAAHPDYAAYPDIVAGAPLGYAIIANSGGAISAITEADITVMDFFTELPAIEQEASTVDVSTTGATARKLIKGVPDAPSALSYTCAVYNSNVAAAIDAMVAAYNSMAAGSKMVFFYLFPYNSENTDTEYFAGSPDNSGISGGAFADARTKSISIIPDLTTRGRIAIT